MKELKTSENPWLTLFTLMLNFYTPDNVREPLLFWRFQGGIEMEQWRKIR